MTWQLKEICEGIFLTAETYGVWIRGSYEKPITRLGRLLPTLIPQLLEMGIAVSEDNAIRISFDNFVELEENDIDAFENIVKWTPFAVELKTNGSMGIPDFNYKIRLYWGRNQIYYERIGCFLKYREKYYRLDKQTFNLIEEIERFNSLSDEERKKLENAYLSFSKIKKLSKDIGAEIDRYITDQTVIIPSKIGVDIIYDKDDRVTFVPKIDDVPAEGMLRAFLDSGDVNEVYTVSKSDGKHVRVLLNDKQKEVLRQMQKVRHVGGLKKAEVLSNPHSVFDGLGDSIDLEEYGERITGIGTFSFTPSDHKEEPAGVLEIEIVVNNPDETKRIEKLRGRKEVLKFQKDIEEAKKADKYIVELNGEPIIINQKLIDKINRILEPSPEKEEISPTDNDASPPKKKGSYLLIHTNVLDLTYTESLGSKEEKSIRIPESFKKEQTLFEHQRLGINWLERNYINGYRGCLLADDMGLGKTLQVLTFLAWFIEKGGISPDGVYRDTAPYNPILIIAPVMLLESKTWIADMKTYFKGEGSVFDPYITLHGSVIKEYRKKGIQEREIVIANSVLELDKLCQNRVIITNYETIINYQFSFAKKEHWSIVVTDEAQEYKTQNTKISHAVKDLSPKFRIACTGTPVETKLSDIWNIFDFLQPGLFESKSEFSKNYESPFNEGKKETLGLLRKKLKFEKPEAYILRRDKTELKNLPKKHEHREECYLSQEQLERYMDLVRRKYIGGKENHPFDILPLLMSLFQHPLLLSEFKGLTTKNEIDDACKKAPKLEKLIEVLTEIKSKGEKVLIFTRSLNMQQILSIVISDKFSIKVEIINGGTKRSGSTQGSTSERQKILNGFREKKGFNVIILSPDVAGTGLTIVEANHVIHYGRWWNPAKESQATDRVYRIGQEKDVHVYYLIAKDPNGTLRTFDEKLDDLLSKRKKMASDFLIPMPMETDLEKELLEDIFKDKDKSFKDKPLTREDIQSLAWKHFEALIALIEEKYDRNVILTPSSGDLGIDVISIDKKHIRLIQCKHTKTSSDVDDDVIDEMKNALDSYRGNVFKEKTNKVFFKLVLAANGTLSRKIKSKAKADNIEIISGDDILKLLEKTPCTHSEVYEMESRRMKSKDDVKAKINNDIE